MGADFGNVPEWVAAAIAGGAAFYAGWSRHEARRSAKAAEDTLHHQQMPQFVAEVENPNGNEQGRNGFHRLMIQVTAAPARFIDRLQVELLTDGVYFTPGLNGIARPDPASGEIFGHRQHTAVHADEGTTPASLDVGDRARWQLEFEEHDEGLPSIGEIQLRVTAEQKGRAPWVQVVHAPVVAYQNSQAHRAKIRAKRTAARDGGSIRDLLG